jgi:hypothetical protein
MAEEWARQRAHVVHRAEEALGQLQSKKERPTVEINAWATLQQR